MIQQQIVALFLVMLVILLVSWWLKEEKSFTKTFTQEELEFIATSIIRLDDDAKSIGHTASYKQTKQEIRHDKALDMLLEMLVEPPK